MKNVHLVPTDKPSRFTFIKYYSYYRFRKDEFINNDTHQNQNIYITTDEEIKEGDWYCSPYGIISKHNGTEMLPDDWRKIILTTDQDLIADGVQAIDDEFLEWFVKNPSREYVNFTSHGNEKGTKDYELIIPKEVPNLTDEKGRPMTYWGGLAETNQDNRMYSEKEVIDLLIEMNSWPTIFEGKEDITEWLNQLKNK